MAAERFRPQLMMTLVSASLFSTSLYAQRGPALVKLAPIVQREVAEGQTFVGTVMPSRRAIIGSAVDGRVVEFPVNEGDRVEEKQPLAQLLTETISHEITAAEMELRIRDAELAELVQGSRDDEKAEAHARMEAAASAAEYQKEQQKRILALYRKGGAATQQQVDEAQWQALEAIAREKETAAAFRLIDDGPRQERIDQARARQLMQQSIVEKLIDQKTKHTIISRFAGYVVAEHSEIGSWVSRGDPVAEVVALDEVDIEAKVVEGQVPYIRVGSSVRVSLPALPQKTFTGTVISVVPQADVRSRTFPVKVRVPNEFSDDNQPLLKSGMLAQVTLPTGARRDALLVPKDALVLGGRQPLIWTVEPDTAQRAADSPLMMAPAQGIPVELGVADGNLIQVQGNISDTASVVVLGNERIPPPRPGQPTTVQWMPTTGNE